MTAKLGLPGLVLVSTGVGIIFELMMAGLFIGLGIACIILGRLLHTKKATQPATHS